MVQVNKLGTGKPASPAKPAAPSGELIGSNPVSVEIAKKVGGVTLPSFLQNSVMPETAEQQFGGYVGFASSQSPKFPLMQQSGLKDGQPFAYLDKNYIPLDKLNFFLCAGESFQTCISGREGNIMFATRDMALKGPQFGTNKTEPHYVILLILDINGTLTPIKGDFKGTKGGGCEGAIAAVRAAADAEWLRLSDAHKATAAFPQPFGRVWHSISTKYEVSKSSGNPYYRTLCVSAPATVSQMERLVDTMDDEEFQKKLEEAHENYKQRVAFLQQAVDKSAKS